MKQKNAKKIEENKVEKNSQAYLDYVNNKTGYAVELLHISKYFNNGQLKANDDLTLRIKKNEIHALVGENGAGKTTIMSILFGIVKPDRGKVFVNGKRVNFHSPNDAVMAGIGMVHQHFKLVNTFTILENIILVAEITRFGFLDKKTAAKKINDLSTKYNLPVHLDLVTRNASVGEQQRTEILKLLYRDAEILIFDEPTAVLSDQEIAGFLKMIKEFKKLGKTIIIITHKLNEVKAVADRATIIRKGQSVKVVDVKKTSQKTIADLMVGKKLVMNVNTSKDDHYQTRPVVCEIQNLNAYKISQPSIKALDDFFLYIHEGEILGLAGIEGNGQTELALILGGLLKKRVNGSVKLYNAELGKEIDVLKSSVSQLYDFGVAHIPEDRLKYGLVLNETTAINVVLPQIHKKPFTRFGFLNHKRITDYAASIFSVWDVHGANGGKALAKSLSGGNQQKMVIGREMTRAHKFAIFVQPTRGIDLGAIQMVHKKIMEDAAKGTAVLLISYELDEILSISSRVAVIDNGKIVYSALSHQVKRSTIGKYLSHSATNDTKIKLKKEAE